ncbi:MAG: methyltransferase domain-containing protein [Candidatus Sumerlaeota bacterium]|nr:methyltransferase domain-containing protein [Candidatus Sumerlaeota bacterium]
MRTDLLHILACPLDASAPLAWFGVEGGPDRNAEMEEGALVCPRCATAFPVLGGIPHLTRGGLRRADRERDFYARHAALLGRAQAELKLDQPPHPAEGQASECDRALMAEGDYWARYLEARVSRGDRSILDVRCKGSHAPFLHAGVAECDDRDARREMGLWPDHLSRPIHEWIRGCGNGAALDVGCGGGQFGLEAACLGMHVAGIDVSLGSLEIARRHALETGRDAQYIYADPAQPPFRSGVFDLILGKDSLHHLPGVEACLRRLEPLLKTDGRVLFYEHAGDSRLVKRIWRLAQRILIPRIQRRYPRVEIPQALLEGSVHEDIGQQAVVPALNAVFEAERWIGEMFLYYEIEQMIYFASGKRSRLAGAVARMIYWLERMILLFQKPDHVLFLGRKKSR